MDSEKRELAMPSVKDKSEMNLHIMTDDKFADPFIEMVTECGKLEENLFVVRTSEQLKFVKNKSVISLNINNNEDFHERIGNVNEFRSVYIHSLDHWICEWLLSRKISRKLIWVFMGFEFFEQSGVRLELYDKETKGYLNAKKGLFKRVISNIKYLFVDRKEFISKKKIIPQISHILHFNKYDFLLLNNYFDTKAEFVPFFYPSKISFTQIESIHNKYLTENSIKRAVPKILIGNSGVPTNNHLESFRIIEDRKIKGDIYCFLNYGRQEYISFISKKGFDRFQSSFNPITNFMDIEQYFYFLSGVDIGIMNHYRTQGMGAIIYLLFLGKRVYLNKKNPAYLFLKDEGAIFFDVENICDNDSLTEGEKNTNRKVVLELFSHGKAEEYFYNILAL